MVSYKQVDAISKALETYSIHNQEEQENQPAITP